jgi:phospholipid transport system transporter-binding protein
MAEITQHANQWRIAGDVLMNCAQTIFSQSAALAMTGDIEVDFSAVTDVDTSALSLIMEWQRRAAAANSQVIFTNLPENLTSLAELYGVTDFISTAKH